MQEELTFPLHPAQEDVYTDQLLDRNSPHYNIGGYIKFKGRLDKKLFYETVGSGPQVFDVFRMRFDLNLPVPVAFLVADNNQMELTDIDFSDLEDSESTALEWMQNRFNTPFLFERNVPLYEQYFIKISEDEYWFFGKYHHLILDGYGFVVWVQYLAQKYTSLIKGIGVPFKFPPYIPEAVKANEYKKSTQYNISGQYWKEKISAKPEKIFQRKYYNNRFKKSETYFLELSEDQRNLLDQIEFATKVRLHHLTIAALLIYFGKTSKESEFVFGIPVHKRISKEARTIVGMFSGIIPYKGRYQENVKLADLLKEISETQKQDYRHQAYNVGDLARALKVSASSGYLFGLTINYKLLNFEISFGEDVNATTCELANEFQKNPLQLCWQDFGKKQPLQLQLDFSTEYFTKKEIDLLANRIIFIVEQFSKSLFNEIGSISIVSPAEKKLIEVFNNKEEGISLDKSIIDLFEAQVFESPEATALIFESEKLTYQQLNERSNQLARFLKSKGVKEEVLVPLCLARSTDMLIAILGVLKAGGAYVPIDPEYPPERIRYMLNDANANILLVDKHSKRNLESIKNVEVINVADYSLFNTEAKDNLGRVSPFGLAYIIYTSGSTGEPKGVMIEHRSVVNLIEAQTREFKIRKDEKILQFSNYCFDASVEQIFLALSNGATLVLIREGLQLNSEQFIDFLIAEEISHLHATPSFLENLPSIDSRFLKRVIAGGDICKNDLAKRWKEKVDFYNEYGPTETTVTAIEYHDAQERKTTNILLPVGKPLTNVCVYILGEKGDVSPIGVLGEIYIGGIQVGRGYLGRIELTQEKFIKDPFSKMQNARLYRTGDMGRWLPDGNIEYRGRLDEQVKIRGYRIELEEIESVLQQSGLLHQVAVLAKEYNGNKRLIGYAVPLRIFDKQAITNYLRNKLPDYMIPSVWVELKEMPVNSNGKVDKKALHNSEDGVADNTYLAPGTALEKTLTQVWEEILAINRVGITDNFLELGGHSLNAMQLVSRLHKLLNIKIDIGKVFANPTVRDLAKALAFEDKSNYIPIDRLPAQESYGLSHAQKRFWVLSHFKDGSRAYNFSGAYTIEGHLNPIDFKRAIEKVIERHENLRTVFIEIDGEPRQKILSPEQVLSQLKEINLQGNPDAAKLIAEAKEFELAHSYDLTTGPLFRITLFRLSDQQHVLLFSIHHIISDGWSKGILINEVLNWYKTYSTGQANDLPELPIQYKDYAAWHTAHITEQKKYWSELFRDDIPVLDFPTDFDRPKVVSFLGGALHVTVPESLTQSLFTLAASHGMSLNSLLFSLYGLLVSEYSEQNEVVIGSLSSGRSHSDLENLIGAFINFIPVKISSDKNLTLSQFLENSNVALVGAYNHQDYPFDLMVDELIKQRDFSHNPFFDTMVNFHSEMGMKTNDDSIKNNAQDAGISLKPFGAGEEELYHSVLDFKLDIEPSAHVLEFYLSYNSRLYTNERMERFLTNFVRLLELATAAPRMKLAQYDSLTFEKEGFKITAPIVQPLLSVNICASFVAEPLEETMEYWNTELDLNIEVSFAQYNQVFQQLLDAGSLLNSNKGLNVLFIRIEDWLKDKTNAHPAEQIAFLESIYRELIEALEKANKKAFAPFLIALVPVYSHDSFPLEVNGLIERLNNELALVIAGLSRMNLLNLERIASLYDVTELYDAKADQVGHIPFTQEYYAAIATYLCRKISAFKENPYKVIALDCDNTLWKGICGEAGAMNVIIDKNFSAFQEFLLEKHKAGFLLVLCSKNNGADVWEVFENHPQMKLKREHIIAYRINWDVKSGNLLSIAKELNLGVDSFIFIDDNEFEIEQVSVNCPDILSITLPEDTEDFAEYFNHIWAFDTFRVTEEDTQRNKMYKVERDRNIEQDKYVSVAEFIESLNINVEFAPLEESNVDRAIQLSLRTNQFNLNGIRKTQQEISDVIGVENSFNRIVKVSDRFGDYGIAGLVLAKKIANNLIVQTFLLSCRVLGRGVEDTILSEMQSFCGFNNIDMIQLLFKSTPKNAPFQHFMERTRWSIDLETTMYYRPLTLDNQLKT